MALTLAVLLSACVSPPALAPSPSAPVASDPAPSTSPAPATAPTAPAVPTSAPALRELPQPQVTLEPGPFAVAASLRLVQVPVTDERLAAARSGVLTYLQRLDWYREDPRSGFHVPGAFGEVVKRALSGSAQPGVKRKFDLISLRVDRFLEKPWAVPALADVTVTIVDRVVSGAAADETETGRLRLLGDRLTVSDAWDASAGRWFNGPEPLDQAALRAEVPSAVAWLLVTESWTPGTRSWEGFPAQVGPFWKARAEHVASFDRTRIVSRTFSDVRARIERVDVFEEVPHGLATVLVTGVIVTTDPSGAERRDRHERRLLVLKGNWTPEVVDEEVSPGVWRSAGGLYAGLKERDRNFA